MATAPAKVEAEARNAARHPALQRLARAGYAAKGVVYLLLGELALRSAVSAGRKPHSQEDALIEVIRQPFGNVMLIILAFGLICFSLWRLIEAVGDPEGRGRNLKGIAARLGCVFSSGAYAALAITAVKLLRGDRGNGNHAQQDWTARVLAQPFGKVAIFIVGAIVVGVGIWQIVRAVRGEFVKCWNTAQMRHIQPWAVPLSRVGICAFGAVFGLAGALLISAAVRSDPREAKGIGGALELIWQQPFGGALLAVVGAGLAAYGFYLFIEAKFRRLGSC